MKSLHFPTFVPRFSHCRYTGWWFQPLWKNISHLGSVGIIIPNIWKNKKMFQITNQYNSVYCFSMFLPIPPPSTGPPGRRPVSVFFGAFSVMPWPSLCLIQAEPRAAWRPKPTRKAKTPKANLPTTGRWEGPWEGPVAHGPPILLGGLELTVWKICGPKCTFEDPKVKRHKFKHWLKQKKKWWKKCSANGRMPVDAVAKKAHGQTQQA